jgi:hypothetical protein
VDRRITIALAVVLALLGGYIWFTFLRPDAPPITAVTPEPTPILFLNIQQSDIAQVQVQELATNKITHVVRAGDVWQMESPKQGPAYFVPVDRLVFDLSRIQVDRKLETPGDLVAFGLNPPQYEVVLTLADNRTLNLSIGGETTDENYGYAMKEGDPAVYLLDFSLSEEIMEFITMPPFTPTPSPTPEPIGTPQPTAAP